MSVFNPSKAQARKMVLASIFVLALVSVYRDRKHGQGDGTSTYRVLWGVGVVGMFLSFLADFLPQIAGPFAGLVALGSLTNGGEQVIAKALGLIAPQPPTAGQPPGPGSPSGTQTTRTGPNTQTTVTTAPGSRTIVQQTGP